MNGVIGIHDLEIATAHHVLDLADLAAARDVVPDKYRIGLGQDQMSVPAADEDVITIGATAARRLLDRNPDAGIRTILFATESGVDQSKSAAVFAHELLGLGSHVRAVEVKHACYGATAAVQFALGLVARDPSERVLVIASDVARYDLRSPGEPTQGAAAVAMLIGADPALWEWDGASGVYTADVDDFWRPNDRSTALVDGALSMSAYLTSLEGSWDDLQRRGGPSASELRALAYHQPFTRMAVKAQARLTTHTGHDFGDDALTTMSLFNRRLGNSYTASVYIALASLADQGFASPGDRVGLYSYGSGSVGELATLRVRSRWEGGDGLRGTLDERTPLTVAAYEHLHAMNWPSDQDVTTPRITSAPFRFAGISGGARRYERTR